MLHRLVHTSLRHPRRVALVWLLIGVLGLAAGGRLFGTLDADLDAPDHHESARVDARLDELDPGGGEVLALVDGVDADDPGLEKAVTATTARLRAVPGVEAVHDRWSAPVPALTAEDGRATLVVVELAGGLTDARHGVAVEEV